jgi:hypothetical protein
MKTCLLFRANLERIPLTLIHRQNSLRAKQRSGLREAQSRGPSPHSKNIPCICRREKYFGQKLERKAKHTFYGSCTLSITEIIKQNLPNTL